MARLGPRERGVQARSCFRSKPPSSSCRNSWLWPEHAGVLAAPACCRLTAVVWSVAAPDPVGRARSLLLQRGRGLLISPRKPGNSAETHPRNSGSTRRLRAHLESPAATRTLGRQFPEIHGETALRAPCDRCRRVPTRSRYA